MGRDREQIVHIFKIQFGQIYSDTSQLENFFNCDLKSSLDRFIVEDIRTAFATFANLKSSLDRFIVCSILNTAGIYCI